MKAVTYYRYGAPDVLNIEEVDQPVPGAGEVLIRVRAAEATKSDCELRSFHYAVKWFWLPMRLFMGAFKPRRPILGGYFSGEIEAVGADVTRLLPGDQVFGSAGVRFGAYAEYMTLPASYTIVPKPSNMRFEDAAAVPLGGLNALHFLRRANVKPGEHVLINGAGGSIGAWAVQIAKAMGAEVTAVDKSNKAQIAERFGADHFIDFAQTDFTATGLSYDVIFDMVPGSSFAACMRCLKDGGRYFTGNPTLARMLRCAFTSRFTDKTAGFAFARETRAELRTLAEMIEAGQIHSIVDTVYPMEEIVLAHQRVENEERVGAIVISI